MIIIKETIGLGATDVFELPVEYPISKIKNITLIIDGSDAWECDMVSFQFVQKKKKSKVYEFQMKKGQKYFSTDSKDGGVKEKTFKLGKVRLF